MKRSISKRYPSAPHETLLVLDGTTGLNMLNQALCPPHPTPPLAHIFCFPGAPRLAGARSYWCPAPAPLGTECRVAVHHPYQSLDIERAINNHCTLTAAAIRALSPAGSRVQRLRGPDGAYTYQAGRLVKGHAFQPPPPRAPPLQCCTAAGLASAACTGLRWSTTPDLTDALGTAG